MCGIAGIIAHQPVNQDLYDALTMIQHRGQDAAGIATIDGDQLHMRKSNGLVRDVIRKPHIARLKGNIGLGHVRYPTAGTDSENEAQPFFVNSPYGLTIVHNGNLTNAKQLKNDLFKEDLRHLNTDSDSEVLINVFAHELQGVASVTLTPEAIFKAVSKTYARCEGAYSAIIMINGKGLLAFRDPHGIRPLVYGKRVTEKGTDYMMASESVALDALGFERVDDIAAGEALFIDEKGKVHRKLCADNPQLTPCIFEYVYLARPDSILNNISVHKVRLAMGKYLAENILKNFPDHDIDVVIPIPDTSRTAAIPLAHHLNVKYREGFVKNRYVGRTFIMPGQALRKKSVRQKLNPVREEFDGKNVLLVDDSIVRGTTSKEIIQMARNVGAKKVYFASAAPEVRYPNVYGIDMPAAQELIAHNKTADEICNYIGADKLFYQDIEDLKRAVSEQNSNIEQFETSIFTGKYITNGIDKKYLKALEKNRGEQ